MGTRRKGGRSTPLPRVPLPRQTGGAHEDKTRRPFRKRKHRKRASENDA